MTDKKKPDNLEMERIKLERLKVYGKIITVLISIGIGTFGVAYINHTLQNKKLEGQLRKEEKKLEGQLKKEEMENLGKYLTHALEDDINKQIRFANYFAKLTISEDVQSRWKDYHKGLLDLRGEIDELEDKSNTATTEQEKEKIKVELNRKKRQTEPIKKSSHDYEEKKLEEALKKSREKREQDELAAKLDREKKQAKLYEKVGLDKNKKPIKYTVSVFEPKSNGQVLYDKTTNLMWQQSGSKECVSYDDVKLYIDKLNRDKFAGFNDWRFPTIKEVITLLKKEKPVTGMIDSDNLYIDARFDKEQELIWASDKKDDSRAWGVSFYSGTGCFYYTTNRNYVRAVRSEQ